MVKQLNQVCYEKSKIGGEMLFFSGETDKILNKWDNHNAIARGWGGVKENYHPVTFRGIYNVDSQTQNL